VNNGKISIPDFKINHSRDGTYPEIGYLAVNKKLKRDLNYINQSDLYKNLDLF